MVYIHSNVDVWNDGVGIPFFGQKRGLGGGASNTQYSDRLCHFTGFNFSYSVYIGSRQRSQHRGSEVNIRYNIDMMMIRVKEYTFTLFFPCCSYRDRLLSTLFCYVLLLPVLKSKNTKQTIPDGIARSSVSGNQLGWSSSSEQNTHSPFSTLPTSNIFPHSIDVLSSVYNLLSILSRERERKTNPTSK